MPRCPAQETQREPESASSGCVCGMSSERIVLPEDGSGALPCVEANANVWVEKM
jgi:hypothetical protein